MNECTYTLTRYWKERCCEAELYSSLFNIKKTIVAVIGDGVDYLDMQLIKKDGESRLLKILDQNKLDKCETGNPTKYGVEYCRKEINTAISEFMLGRSPYNIVPQYAESDLTTDLCKVIGGASTGILNSNDFICVKLKRGCNEYYNDDDIISALDYLYGEAKTYKRPMAVYIPLEIKARLDTGRLNDIERAVRRLSEVHGVVIITTTGSRSGYEMDFSASGLSELQEVISTAPYSEIFEGINYDAGRINYRDYKTPSPILFGDTGYPVICDDLLYTVKGIAVSGAVGAAASAAVLEWALVDGKKKNIYLEDIRLMLIKSSESGYIENSGFGPVLFDKLNILLM